MLLSTTSSGGAYVGDTSPRSHLQCGLVTALREWVLPPILRLVQGELGWAGVTVKERCAMKVATSPPLYWKVCLINGAVFIGAAALLVVSPATVSYQVTGPELAVLAIGLVVILLTNAALLHSTLAPLDRLIRLIDRFEPEALGRRLPRFDRGVAATLAASFNDLLGRLEMERATRSARELAAQESERHRIAQELHDEVGQRLTAVLLGLKRALDRLPPDAAGELRLVQETARTSLDEVRRVARGLRPGVLEDLGLVPALKAMVSELSAQTDLQVRRSMDQAFPALRSEAELVIFRVAQEAFTNVTRHADARTVELSLRRTPRTVSLRIADDGRGIRADAAGAGINGIRERALLLGGQLSVAVGKSGGTEVRLDLPLEQVVR